MMGWYGSGMGPGTWLLTVLFWMALLGSVVWLVPSSDRPAARRAASAAARGPVR